MDCFKIDELLSRLTEMKNDGYEYAEISLLGHDISLEAIESYSNGLSSTVDYETVSSCKLPDGYEAPSME